MDLTHRIPALALQYLRVGVGEYVDLAVQGDGASDLLSVFGKGPRYVAAPTSTIGIRGTGLHAEAEPDLTYTCTCYGETDIAAANDPTVTERIVSFHHDAPRYVLAKPDKGKRIVPAPFKNHDDLDLMLIEILLGRTPPFSLFDESYGRPRRYREARRTTKAPRRA